MAGSVNKVILIVNLGRDPEIRATQNGKQIASLSVATSETWKDKSSGERKERTEWHKVVVFNEGLVNLVDKYLRKGAKLYIEGQLQTRKWTGNDGKDNYSTEIVLQAYNGTLTMLDGVARSNGGASEPRSTAAGASAPAAKRTPRDDIDDEIPF